MSTPTIISRPKQTESAPPALQVKDLPVLQDEGFQDGHIFLYAYINHPAAGLVRGGVLELCAPIKILPNGVLSVTLIPGEGRGLYSYETNFYPFEQVIRVQFKGVVLL